MKKWLIRIVAALVIVPLVVMGTVYAVASYKVSKDLDEVHRVPVFQMRSVVASADLELGKRIVTIRNGCVDCHGANLAGTTIIDDRAMGTYTGANITPAALKSWSDEQITAAIRYGVNREGRSLTCMPSFDYQGLSREDIAAIVAYLRSVPAVEVMPPPSRIGPMAKVLYLFGKMPILVPAKSVNFSKGFPSKPPEAASAKFGEYLVQTSCVGCHRADLTGGPVPGGPPDWPPAVDLRFASQSMWTREKFFDAMRTGISARNGQPIRFPMPIALTKQLTDIELQAMWLYLSEQRAN